ncbi:MAG: hypothetical protein L0H93_16545, partial [Nocardioides sp.]|nr:hypothetical protein [Nocardioides sp.]
MTNSSPAFEDENDGLKQASLGVESEPQLAVRPFRFVKRLDPERPIGRLDCVLGKYPVLER